MYGWIGLNYMTISKIKHNWCNAQVHFPFEHVMRGREIQDKHCINCLTTLDHQTATWWMPGKVPPSCFCFCLYRFWELLFLIFHFLFTNFGFWPFFWKNNPILRISASDLYNKIGCTNKPLPKEITIESKRKFILVVSRSPHLTKAWLPWVLERCVFRVVLFRCEHIF